MEIHTRNKDLRKAVEDDGQAIRLYGMPMASKMRLRVAALRAAETLADFWPPNSGPERCHELKGNLKGTFSVDLKQPYRLLFTPVEDDAPKNRLDEHERWKKIVEIELIEVTNTHD